jgi:hypothetical protein
MISDVDLLEELKLQGLSLKIYINMINLKNIGDNFFIFNKDYKILHSYSTYILTTKGICTYIGTRLRSSDSHTVTIGSTSRLAG